MAVTAKQRQIVYDRDGRMCANCGNDQTLTIQHRINRGMGGSKTRDGFENLLTLCALCNQRLEMVAEVAERGIDLGQKLRSWDDPLKVPVFFAFDGWYYLTERGTRIKRPTRKGN